MDRFSKKAHTSSFIKIRSVGAELFHADRQSFFVILRTRLKTVTADTLAT